MFFRGLGILCMLLLIEKISISGIRKDDPALAGIVMIRK